MAIIKCPECHHDVSEHAQTCPGCGVRIAGNIVTCPECKELVLRDEHETCPNCGCALPPVSDLPSTPEHGDIHEPDTPSEETPPHGLRKKVVAWIVVVVLTIVLAGAAYYYLSSRNAAAQEEEAYEMLADSNTVEEYEDFLKKYPNSSHYAEVESRLNQLKSAVTDWNNIALSASKSDFIAFLQKYPKSMYNELCNDKIDSLDWIEATVINTADGYDRYVREHPSGKYVDNAYESKANLENMAVTPEGKANISTLFSSYFEALTQQDEVALCSTLNAQMDNYLNKRGATKTDAIAYMNKLHQSGHTNLTYSLNNDYAISKVADGKGGFAYAVAFTVDEHKDSEDGQKSSLTSYKVVAKVLSTFKITELNMRKIVGS